MMNSLIDRTLGAWLSKLGQSDMFNSEARGYVGMLGALVALVGLWLPFVNVIFSSISYFDLLLNKESPFPVVVILVLLAVLSLCAARLQGLAFPAAVIYSIAFALSNQSLLAEAGIELGALADVGSGFYVMVIGLILMLLSPFLWRINEKVETLLQNCDTNNFEVQSTNGDEKAPIQNDEAPIQNHENNSRVRGYIGIVGSVIALIGMFVPYAELWFVRASIFEILVDTHKFVCFVAIILLILSAIGFFRFSNIGGLIGGILLIGLLIGTFGDSGGMTISQMMQYLEYGFWVMVIGLILMILSPFMKGANAKFGTLFHTPANRE